jgi:hypothetical protein
MQPDAPWYLRALLVVGALEALAIGASGFLAPSASLFHRLLPITVSPLNGRVIGAFYLAGAIGLIGSLLARRPIDSRIFVYGFGFIAGSMLLITLAYWSDFTKDHVPYGWIVSYIVEPVVGAIAIVRLGLTGPSSRGTHRWTPLFAVQGAVLGLTGLLFLLLPQTAVDIWPWKLTVLLARVYAPFFLGFALGAFLACWERRPAAVRPFLVASFALPVLVLIGSLQHRDRFSGSGEWVWFGALAVAIVAFAVATADAILQARSEREAAVPPESSVALH